MATTFKMRTLFLALCSFFLLCGGVDNANALPSQPPPKSPVQIVRKPMSFVAFGDSLTTPYLPGTTSWFTFLKNNLRSHFSYASNFTNLSLNGKFVSPFLDQNNNNLQFDIQAQLNLITSTDYGLVLLGTNDATQGIDLTTFQNYYKQFIQTVKNSGKIGRLYILAVPPMISPYNCIGSTCWNNTHNPQTERVVPYNNFLSTIGSYCTSIGYLCSYINSSAGFQLNTTYLNGGDGIHLTNVGQTTVSNNVYNVVSKNITPACQTIPQLKCIAAPTVPKR